MSILGNRIKKEREYIGLTRDELANKIGVSYSAIAMYEQGNREPNNALMLKMCELFNCTIDYLMGNSDYRNSDDYINHNTDKTANIVDTLCLIYTDAMKQDNLDIISNLKKINEEKIINDLVTLKPSKEVLNNTLDKYLKEFPEPFKSKYKSTLIKLYEIAIAKDINPKPESNVFPIPESVVKVPIIGKIAAGIPILAIENIIDYAFAPASQIKEGFEYFYLYVEGDSMNLKFNEGDLILIQQQDYLENKEIGVFLIEEEATVKQFREQKGNIFILDPMSSNPINHTQMYDIKETPVKIIGKVISYQGKI